MKNPLDLISIARKAMLKNGFILDPPDGIPPAQVKPNVKDLRELLWSSIDDATTRDLDQVEYAERLPNEDIRVWVGIADVDVYVAKDSAIDQYAAQNCTSVYTGVKTFPMLPEILSTDLTSLVEGEDRHVVITELVVSQDGAVNHIDIFCALINNKAKLVYEEIGAWLEGKSGVPASVSAVAGMESQIRLQAEAAAHLAEFRKRKGAIELGTIQAVPVTNASGTVIKLKVIEPNRARDLISNFMIAANVAMAEFLEDKGGPSLRRVVRSPEQWERIVEIAAEHGVKLPATPDSMALSEFLVQRKQADPLHFPDLSLAVVKALGPGAYIVQAPGEEAPGHFGLAVDDYTHSTAPNRRFSDLVTQRLVKAAIACTSVKKQRPSIQNLNSNQTAGQEGRLAPASVEKEPSSIQKLNSNQLAGQEGRLAPASVEKEPFSIQKLNPNQLAGQEGRLAPASVKKQQPSIQNVNSNQLAGQEGRLAPADQTLLEGKSPYSVDELRDIAARCTEREDASRKVERKMRKVAAALLLHDKIGQEFDAIVTGVTPKGTFARLLKPPADGRITRGERGLRVGDKIRVRLLSTDPERGFIDFAKT